MTEFEVFAKEYGIIKLASDMDVAKFSIYRWINGEARPNITNIKKINSISKGKVDLNSFFKEHQQGANPADTP